MPRAQEASTQTCGSILVRLGTHLGYDIICIMRPRSAGARSPGFEPRAKSAIAAVWFPSGHPITRRTLLAALERQTADRIDPLRRCRRQVQSLVTPHLMVCRHRARGFAVTLRGLQLSHALQEGFAAKRNLIVDLGEGSSAAAANTASHGWHPGSSARKRTRASKRKYVALAFSASSVRNRRRTALNTAAVLKPTAMPLWSLCPRSRPRPIRSSPLTGIELRASSRSSGRCCSMSERPARSRRVRTLDRKARARLDCSARAQCSGPFGKRRSWIVIADLSTDLMADPPWPG